MLIAVPSDALTSCLAVTITNQRKNIEEQERQLTEYRRDEQINAETTAAWDTERERWRVQLATKQQEIETMHQQLVEMENLQAEVQSLHRSNQMLSQDVTDARRQASEPRSTPNTLTRGSGMAIGHELRESARSGMRQGTAARADSRQLFTPIENTVEASSEEELCEATDELDEANTSVGRAFGVPAPPLAAKEEADDSLSTESEVDAQEQQEEEEEQQRTPTLQGDQSQMTNPASEADSSPPTYDEASLEQRITSRLHPTHAASVASSSGTATADVHAALRSKNAEEAAYLLLRNELGIRCTAIEELIEKHRRDNPKAAAAAAEEEEADNSIASSSSSTSSESTTVPNDDAQRFARLRKLPRDASDRAVSLYERASQYLTWNVLRHLPHDVYQTALHSGAAGMTFYCAHKVMIYSVLIFVLGAAIGSTCFPQAHPFATPTVVLENAREWSIANSFEAARVPWGALDAQVSRTWLERISEFWRAQPQPSVYPYHPT